MHDMIGERRTSILTPGENCWQKVNANRAAVAIDGEAYFARFVKPFFRRMIRCSFWGGICTVD